MIQEQNYPMWSWEGLKYMYINMFWNASSVSSIAQMKSGISLKTVSELRIKGKRSDIHVHYGNNNGHTAWIDFLSKAIAESLNAL